MYRSPRLAENSSCSRGVASASSTNIPTLAIKIGKSRRPRPALERLLIERGPFVGFQAWIGQGRAEWRANQVAITVGARRCC